MAGFVALGQKYEVEFQPLKRFSEEQPIGAAAASARRRSGAARVAAVDPAAMARVVAASPVLRSRVDDPLELAVVETTAAAGGRRRALAAPPVAPPRPSGLMMVTQTVIGEGLRQADLAAAKKYGAKVLDEGLDGKILLKVDSVKRVFGLVELLQSREVGSVSPNFLRRVIRLAPSTPVKAWALDKIGVPAAWAITKGNASIKVAVLDEGVDTQHPSLKAAVVAERDFIGGQSTAMPDGDDAHGTACAGIVLSRSATFPGVAPRCSLIGVRIAMDDGTGGWVFDDFATADAIDWSWRQGADVLSNSWGGGLPSDAISRAFARARTQGRNGRGAVVVIAAGNAQEPIDFPGNLPGYVTVGASNHQDERKTRTSSDGENWWGSNFGPTMRLVAPGVFIWTTDISGANGYDPTDFTKTFNGTSSSTPHVAGCAALMLSVAPHLSASTIRNLLGRSAKRIEGQTGWTPELGWGRLDVAKAVTMAKATNAPTGGGRKTKAARKKR